MKLRGLKRRHDFRRSAYLQRERLAAVALEDFYDDDFYDDDFDDDGCTHCGGEGFREVEDPLWDECDEFGFGPCTSCNGTGRRSRQWVF